VIRKILEAEMMSWTVTELRNEERYAIMPLIAELCVAAMD
jgi:hypothetical protein